MNELLHNRVIEVNLKLKRNLSNLLKVGIDNKEIKADIDTDEFAGIIIGMIEGSVYMTFVLKDDRYMKDMMNQIDQLIDSQLTI